jgi:amidase
MGGSNIHRDRIPDIDHVHVERLRAAGAISIGKTTTPELGWKGVTDSPLTGATGNPWNTARTAGGSSGGSAAAVALGMAPLSLGTDGGGSVRIPAACNGLVGLKATRGRIPSDKFNREMPVRIVHDGVVTRSVRDTAAFIRESERVYRDLKLAPVGDVTHPGKARLRIALVTNSIGGRTTDDETTQTVEKTAALLEEVGHHVEPVEAPVPDSFEDDFLLYWSALALALSKGGKHTFNRTYDGSKNDNLTKGLARHAAKNAWRLPVAIARLKLSHRISKAFFADHDVMLTPTLSLTTPELGWLDPRQSFETVMGRILEWVSFTPLQNATGDPAISLPMGMSSKGLPIGVHLSAAQGYDRRLLEIAYELEEAQPFARIQG